LRNRLPSTNSKEIPCGKYNWVHWIYAIPKPTNGDALVTWKSKLQIPRAAKWGVAVGGLLLGLTLGYLEIRKAQARYRFHHQLTKQPYIVELYTSQGCSSCPSADALLDRLAKQGGSKLIPLVFHVDYWDESGWKDPFSQPSWTERQSEYLRHIAADGMFTPQAIIQGRFACVGSDETCILESLNHSPDNYVPILDFRTTHDDKSSQNAIKLLIQVSENISKYDELQVVAIRFEHGRQTQVTSGENRGKTLQSNFVVQELRVLGMVSHHDLGKPRVFPIPWVEGSLAGGWVALAQDVRSRKIYAAIHQEWNPHSRLPSFFVSQRGLCAFW
jgi:hypothetical protein